MLPGMQEATDTNGRVNAQSVSAMLQRYFTPASGALAVAAVQRAVENESSRRTRDQLSTLQSEGLPTGGDSPLS